MKYRIQSVSKMIGISPQTIRFYEKYGILPASRQEENSERQYSTVDINILMRSRMYRNAGFTLAQSAQLQNQSEAEDMRRFYLGKADELEKEIDRQQRILARLKGDALTLSHIPDSLYVLHPTVSPGIYGMIYSDAGGRTPIDKRRYAEICGWVDLMPIAQPLVLFRKDELPSSGRSLGLYVAEKDADLLAELPQENIFHIPPRPSLYTVIEGYAREHEISFFYNRFMQETFLPAGHRLAGDVIGRVITSLDCNKRYRHYTELWLPVEE